MPHQKVTRSLHNLTTSVATSIANDTATYTPTTFDPNIEDTITSSYGLLTNTVEEFMFDLFYQEQVLKSYSQQHGIYRNLLHLNSTFAVSGPFREKSHHPQTLEVKTVYAEIKNDSATAPTYTA